MRTGFLYGTALAAALLTAPASFVFAAESDLPPPQRQSAPEEAGAAAVESPEAADEKPSPQVVQEQLRRWQELTPQERQRLIELYRKFQSLPEPNRRLLRERLGEWRKMPQQQRQRIRGRFRRFAQAGGEHREALRGRAMRWRAMGEERRFFIRKALAVLTELPKETIDQLKALPSDQRREALVEILAQHGVEIPGAAGDAPRRGERARHRLESPEESPPPARDDEEATQGPQRPAGNRRRGGRQR